MTCVVMAGSSNEICCSITSDLTIFLQLYRKWLSSFGCRTDSGKHDQNMENFLLNHWRQQTFLSVLTHLFFFSCSWYYLASWHDSSEQSILCTALSSQDSATYRESLPREMFKSDMLAIRCFISSKYSSVFEMIIRKEVGKVIYLINAQHVQD